MTAMHPRAIDIEAHAWATLAAPDASPTAGSSKCEDACSPQPESRLQTLLRRTAITLKGFNEGKQVEVERFMLSTMTLAHRTATLTHPFTRLPVRDHSLYDCRKDIGDLHRSGAGSCAVTTPRAMKLTTATVADVPAIAALMNLAYRGGGSDAGWTSETDCLAGDRTSEAVLGEDASRHQ